MLKVINSFIKYLEMRRVYNRTYKELQRLTDRELYDIGLSRCDIAAIAQESVNSVVVEKKNTVDVLSALKALFNARLALR